MRIEIVPGITVDSERVFGTPVIAGTRVTAAQVLASLAAGLSEVEIQAEHGLTKEQIRAALRYAAVLAMVREIEANPQPDGVFKRTAPPPFKPGTIVAIARRHAVRYAIWDEPGGGAGARVRRLVRCRCLRTTSQT
jgi:uncharacterized protein (DUF433 family)